ncbi:Peroxidase [Mycena chlorophos]|uniref:Peroxidase n=1 Tax=Mycena chlorophos TaxID=658473 RepID=A0A8H6WQK4_MYCCL|nr:Peroxidase [Mycena chlorophos]
MKPTTLFLSLFSIYVSSVVGTSHLRPRSGFEHRRATAPAQCSGGRTANNAQCCVWYDVLDDIQANLFEGGQCGEDAHEALRLSFHDAIGYSPALKASGQFSGGGADGSLIMFANTELGYDSNDGLDDIVSAEKKIADRHHVSYGDFIQFAAVVSVRNCAGGPLIPFLAGRPDATNAAPDGLVPEAFDSVTKILARVTDAGLTSDDLVDLLASHSIGQQDTVDTSIPGTPFDTTPSVLDTNFYLETLLHGTVWPGNGAHQGEVQSPFKGEFRLQSDWALARDSRTACRWQGYINDQPTMATRFSAAMAKMALLGQNPNALTDCSDVIPAPTLSAPKVATMPQGKTVADLDWTKCPASPSTSTSNGGSGGSGPGSWSGPSAGGSGKWPAGGSGSGTWPAGGSGTWPASGSNSGPGPWSGSGAGPGSNWGTGTGPGTTPNNMNLADIIAKLLHPN